MYSITDLEAAARRRLPRRVYDFIAGGAGAEASVRNNVEAFQRIRFVPRTMVDIQRRTMAARLLGRDYAAPFGIAPMGMCDIAWPGTDEGLARAARTAGIPYCLSMAGSSALAEVHRHAGEYLWYQVYLCGSDALWERQFSRAEALGVENLILTVDVPVPGRRLRDLRNGFSVPVRWTPSLLLDFATHPAWSLRTLARGAPRMRNMESFAGERHGASSLDSILAIFASAVHEWEVIERLRDRWKGKLIIKGILHPADAVRLAGLGADAIVVSNHGGRQLSSAISSIEALPAIRHAIGREFPLILDSGIRSGEDIAKALAYGADFVLVGRPFLFGSAALGPARGPQAVIRILQAELDMTLAQLGCTSPAMLSPDFVHVTG
ncbi:alpha-hydroxy-acid oxidizing protein [Sphingomonas sp. MG17]|uniref:Alpha-hydroxy-acid oxidizing protein n=1 Tax=Sphingomonas tagetis TaxID=2949092 RepID=A0A9X2KM65_9SPHN|nr:alpha-hydroxy acid oxidase [Sphingomonas tagetis]MCP3731352.1 alpha-hydroxy-acid oxidizing protein [Sphingomonas tagetis]